MKDRLKVGSRVSCVVEGIFPNFISLSFRSAGVIYRGVLLNETCSTVKRVIPENYFKEKKILQREVTDSLYNQVNDRELDVKSKGLRSIKSKQACLVLDNYIFETDQTSIKKENDESETDKRNEKTEKSMQKSPIDSLFGLVESIDKNVGKPTFNENKLEKPKAKPSSEKLQTVAQGHDNSNKKAIHKKDSIVRLETGKSDTNKERITLESFLSLSNIEDQNKTQKYEFKRGRKRSNSKCEKYVPKPSILDTVTKQGISTPPSKKFKQEESPSSVASTPDEKRKRKKIKKLTYDPKQRRRLLKIAESSKSVTTEAIVKENAIPIVKIDVKKIIRKKASKQKRIDPITLALKNIKNREKTRRRLRMSVMTRKALAISPNDLLRKAERKPLKKQITKKKKKLEETKNSKESDIEDASQEDVVVSSSKDESVSTKGDMTISEENSVGDGKEKKKNEIEKQKETQNHLARHNTRSNKNLVNKPLLSLQGEAPVARGIMKHTFGTRSSGTKTISTTRSGIKFLSTPKSGTKLQKPLQKKTKPKFSNTEEKNVKDDLKDSVSVKPAQSAPSSTYAVPTSSTTPFVSAASNHVSLTWSHMSIESNEIDLLCHEKVVSPESEIPHPPQRKNRRKPLQVFKSLPNPATATNILDSNVYKDLNDYTSGIVSTESKSPESVSETQVFPKLKRSDAELYGIDSLSSDRPYKITITRMNRPTLIPRRFLDSTFTPSYQTYIQKPVPLVKPSPIKHLQKPGSMLTCHVELEKPASDASSTTSSTVTLDEANFEECKLKETKVKEEDVAVVECSKKVSSKQPAKPKKRKKQAIFAFQETLKPLTRSNKDIRLGDIVWGKVFGYGWWPGTVLSKVRDADSIEKRVFCAWMGSNTNSTMNISDLELFLPNFAKRFDVKKSSQSYTKAVIEAQHGCSTKYGLK